MIDKAQRGTLEWLTDVLEWLAEHPKYITQPLIQRLAHTAGDALAMPDTPESFEEYANRAISDRDKMDSTTTTVPLDRLLDIGQDEDGSWHVSIVAMPGHVGAAATLEQAIDEAVEAAELWIATLNDRITELERRLDARDSYELEQRERT